MPRLSARVRDLRGSPVRTMLSLASRPGVISFGNGLPAEETFEDLELPAPPRALLQYGPSEGEPELRARIAEELAALGLDAPAERVMVLSGSQQGIDLAAKLVVDPGAAVAVELPAYLAALQVLRFFGADLRILDPADPGAHWRGERAPALAYVTPTFQNPTGRCWTLGERRALAGACDRDDVILFEDDPYRELAYEPCERRPACTFVRRAAWIYQGSFSKTVAPGLRLGFLAASQDLFGPLVRLKQAADLHASRLGQWIVLRHMTAPGRAARLARIAGAYRAKRDHFAAVMARTLDGLAEWSVPPGGLFFWATLAEDIDARGLFEAAAERGVLFSPGEHFLVAPDDGRAAMRLNFSHATAEEAERGLAILSELLRGRASGAARLRRA